jgi:hypothetical protein
MQYIVESKVKKLIREQGKIPGKEFLLALDIFVAVKIKQACKVHNGGKKTLDATVAGYAGIK